jgi:membrane protein DedA with SNARE-associated domain/rhodanese-related sulfurtransferase
MQHITALIAEFGLLAVFLNVLLDEGGLPLPSYPLLAVAGALTATGHLSILSIIGAAVAGSAIADNSWYWASRALGRRVLALLCKLSLSPDSCVRQTETVFTRVGPVALLFAKFVPGLGNITVALSGITRVSPAIFIPLQLMGASIYLGLPVLLGRIFHNAVADVLNTLAALGEIGLGIIVAALALYLLLRWWQRKMFIRQLRMDRISVDELVDMMAEGSGPLLLDVRSAEARQRDGMIPGAIAAHPSDMNPILKDHARDVEIVVYCACPNEATAAMAAKHLRRAGFRKIRPLLGGVEAWAQAGHQLQFSE